MRPRLGWIDLLRGIAVVGMLETHVLNTFLIPEAWPSWSSRIYFLNGLLSAAFLWIAGFIQGLAIRRAHAAHTPVFTRTRLRRLAQIFLMGYLLHVPTDYWMRRDFGVESWRVFFQVDILQCMTVSLLCLMGMGALPKKGLFDPAVAVLLVLCVAFAPYASLMQVPFLPIDAFVSAKQGSLFPLFPWFAFCAAGCLAGRWPIREGAYLVIGILLAALGYWGAPSIFSKDSPAFFAERLGWLLIVVSVVHALGRRWHPQWLMLAGKESLLIYIAHLILIYWLPLFGGATLTMKWGLQLNWLECAQVFVILLVVCLVLAWFNQRRKKKGSLGLAQTPLRTSSTSM